MRIIFGTLTFLFISVTAQAQQTSTVDVDGLNEPVEIIKDEWGVSHIYAQNQKDLFFAQGYNAARDRLFQFEIWRRKATGTLAEIMGKKALEHDKGARLLRFRDDLDKEIAHYHEDGAEIINAFVDGVNAYIRETEKNPDLLPFEFDLLGIKPGYWTAEIVVSRHNALTGGISNEIMLSKMITALGEEKVRKIMPFYRNTHLKPFDGIDLSKINHDIMSSYIASRSMPEFEASDLRNPDNAIISQLNRNIDENFFTDPIEGINNIGSNNWVLDGTKTKSGKPLMANDPHRSIQSPSLRYMVHLNAPAKDGKRGWNVIGGGEPVLPGVSIGHNDFGAWGLTIFRIDQEDLYIYRTNPANPNQYWYQGKWTDMHTENTVIKVKGMDDQTVTLKYSVHGPVLSEDSENNIAYGLKAAWLSIGATPYLASLRMDQAETFEEFRDACSFSGLPGENMVWADKNGTIGWQSVGLTPVRFGWDGSLPIPGDGTYEWNGYVPIKSMPHITNPKSGWYGTANHHNVPDGYPNIFSDFYSDPARYERLTEVMNAAQNHDIEDSKNLQYDNKSINAAKITPLLNDIKIPRELKEAVNILTSWDHRMNRDSTAAALYDIWEQVMIYNVQVRLYPEEQIKSLPSIRRQKLKDWLVEPTQFVFGNAPLKKRDKLMIYSLEMAIAILTEDFGKNMKNWKYGNIHFSEIIHPLSHLVDEETQKKINTVALPRGGAGNTLNANGGQSRQSSGGSFRMIVDTADWDRTVGTNSPGQSGNPDSKHYKNLFENWNRGDYFPLYFSKDKIEATADQIINLK